MGFALAFLVTRLAKQARALSNLLVAHLPCSLPEYVLHGHPILLLNPIIQRLTQRTSVRVDQTRAPRVPIDLRGVHEGFVTLFSPALTVTSSGPCLTFCTWKVCCVKGRTHHLFHHAMPVRRLDLDQGLVVVDLNERPQRHHAAFLDADKNDFDEVLASLPRASNH